MADITQTVRLLMDARKAATEMQRVGRNFDSLNKKVGAIAKTAGLAFAGTQLVKFATETAKLAAEAQGVTTAFNRLNDPGLLADLQAATKGTVNNLELMRNTVRAVQLGIDQNELAKYFEFASLRAQQTGESVQELVDKLVLGVGRQSVLRLDDLGLSAKRLGEEAKKAGDFVKGVGVIIDEELGKAGGVVENAAVNFQQLSAEVDNLKLAIGQSLLPVFKVFLTTTLNTVEAFKALAKYKGIVNKDFINRSTADAQEVVNGTVERYYRLVKEGQATEAAAIASINKRIAAETRLGNNVNQSVNARAKAIIQVDAWRAGLADLTQRLNANGTAIGTSTKSLNDLNTELKQLQEEQGLATTAAQFAVVASKINAIESSIKAIKTPLIQGAEATLIAKDAQVDLTTGIYAANEAWRQQQVAINNTTATAAAGYAIQIAEQQRLNQQMQIAGDVASYFGQGLQDVFYTSLINGASFFQQMGQYLKKLAAQLISAAIAAAALAVAFSAIGLGSFNISGIFTKGGGFGKLFKGLAGIPGLAEGGIVTGPTLALIGEGRESEAVIPLSKLGQMTGGGGQVFIPELRIAGNDLLILFEQAKAKRDSRYGR